MVELLTNAEINFLLYIQESVRNPWLDPIVTFLTSLGNAGWIWILLSALLLIPKKTRKIGFISFLSLFASLIVNNLLLKNLVGRIRPYDACQSLLPLVAKPVDASFPSGHTGSSFASAYVMYRYLPKREGIAAIVLAALISLSRLYVGVHYPSDVLTGMMTGIWSGYLAEWAYQRFFVKIKR